MKIKACAFELLIIPFIAQVIFCLQAYQSIVYCTVKYALCIKKNKIKMLCSLIFEIKTMIYIATHQIIF